MARRLCGPARTVLLGERCFDFSAHVCIIAELRDQFLVLTLDPHASVMLFLNLCQLMLQVDVHPSMHTVDTLHESQAFKQTFKL